MTMGSIFEIELLNIYFHISEASGKSPSFKVNENTKINFPLVCLYKESEIRDKILLVLVLFLILKNKHANSYLHQKVNNWKGWKQSSIIDIANNWIKNSCDARSMHA